MKVYPNVFLPKSSFVKSIPADNVAVVQATGKVATLGHRRGVVCRRKNHETSRKDLTENFRQGVFEEVDAVGEVRRGPADDVGDFGETSGVDFTNQFQPQFMS
jgi:hypothetical protein